MRHTAPAGYDPVRKKDFGWMVLAFSAPPLCAILGIIIASALGYPPF